MKIVLILSLFLPILADWGENPTAERNDIVLYRKKDYFAGRFVIKINGQRLVDNMGNNSYLVVSVPAGRVVIETDGGYQIDKQRMIFYTKPNVQLFLKGVVDYDYMSSALYFERVETEKATKEIKKLTRIEPLIKLIE